MFITLYSMLFTNTNDPIPTKLVEYKPVKSRDPLNKTRNIHHTKSVHTVHCSYTLHTHNIRKQVSSIVVFILNSQIALIVELKLN
jgi:hypothetical protein